MSSFNMEELNKAIQKLEDAIPVWQNEQLDKFMEHHKDISKVLMVTPTRFIDSDRIKTKYGWLEISVNPMIPPDSVYFVKRFDPLEFDFKNIETTEPTQAVE
jgi:hypothetical protein